MDMISAFMGGSQWLVVSGRWAVASERFRAFVRIRIYRICGIFRISFRPARAVRHNRKLRQAERGQTPAYRRHARCQNPENPIIPQILILTNTPRNQPLATDHCPLTTIPIRHIPHQLE